MYIFTLNIYGFLLDIGADVLDLAGSTINIDSIKQEEVYINIIIITKINGLAVTRLDKDKSQ